MSCFYKTYAIPENYTGTLTIGNVGTSSASTFTVMLRKPATNAFRSYTAAKDGSNNLSINIADPEYFSSAYEGYELHILDENFNSVKLVESSVSYDYLILPFSPPDCTTVFPISLTLTKDTTTPCTTCQ